MPALVSPALPDAVWRASQLGSHRSAVAPTGYAALDRELPGGGWPSAALIELLLRQAGIGEMQLLRPALAGIAPKRRIALVQPPHAPQAAAWSAWGLPAERLLWVRAARSADAMWSAEQILRNGSCGALLFWPTHARPEALRRLHLAAQAADILFWAMRPLAGAQDASPAPLRLALHPANGGVKIAIVKRRGPLQGAPLHLALDGLPSAPASLAPSITPVSHARLDRRVPAAAAARNLPAALV
ncbi:translesion DNA synthesis-associated protein ImuA [Noviherbaspirillum sp. UKPF54]|uniref:translesion DNA synthesis-associated protein ImuA n=1 Tax=Noviherbaspirillum sp. UKPF54 TaxID=2601898 RepID=UPI0011B140FD|nr:translesion DNA synthesis-associated protein ImuA [Noviherbaspirillum sp. UKPF54]QDZ27758.1 translesion DNA synthesis-associated protein ImuA [Noviherbaspirillum sp. UKPF54]